MAPKAAPAEKSYSAETIKALFAALYKRGVVVGNPDYTFMAKVNTGSTASSYEHQFRDLKKQAAEIAKNTDGGATPKGMKTPKTSTPGAGKKRGKAVATEGEDDAEETPSKKKVKKQKAAKKEESAEPGDVVQEPIVEDGSDTNVYGGASFFEDAIPMA